MIIIFIIIIITMIDHYQSYIDSNVIMMGPWRAGGYIRIVPQMFCLLFLIAWRFFGSGDVLTVPSSSNYYWDSLRSVFNISCLFLRPRPWQCLTWDSTDK